MSATFLPIHLADDATRFHCHTVAAAAKKLGISEATIRRAARSLGVRKIAGPAVAGFVVWAGAHGGTIDVVLPVYEMAFESRPEYAALAAASETDPAAEAARRDWIAECV